MTIKYMPQQWFDGSDGIRPSWENTAGEPLDTYNRAYTEVRRERRRAARTKTVPAKIRILHVYE